MNIKSIVKVIKGLFKGEIPGYIKIKLSDEKLRTTLDIFEEDLWENISQTELRCVAKVMLNKLYFNTNAINLVDMTDYKKEVELIRMNEIRDKLISDIKKLEAA